MQRPSDKPQSTAVCSTSPMPFPVPRVNPIDQEVLIENRRRPPTPANGSHAHPAPARGADARRPNDDFASRERPDLDAPSASVRAIARGDRRSVGHSAKAAEAPPGALRRVDIRGVGLRPGARCAQRSSRCELQSSSSRGVLRGVLRGVFRACCGGCCGGCSGRVAGVFRASRDGGARFRSRYPGKVSNRAGVPPACQKTTVPSRRPSRTPAMSSARALAV